MKIRVDKLRKSLALLQAVVPKKPNLEILSNVLVKDRRITGGDLEISLSVNLPEADGNPFLLPCKKVSELLKYVPGDEPLTLEEFLQPQTHKRLLKLSWDSGSAAYEVADADEYPEIDEQEPRAWGYLNGDVLVAALEDALPYCATDSTRLVLTGVTLYLGSVLQVAAADGFRLSFQSLNQSFPLEEKVVIPAAAIKTLKRLWRQEPAQAGMRTNLIEQITQPRRLRLSVWESRIRVEFAGLSLTSKLIEGNPPDHLHLLNGFKEPIKVKLMASDLYAAVRRVQSIAREGSGIVRLQWTDSQMTVSARSAETGEVRAVIPVQSGTIPGRTALNVVYLLDYLADKEGLITLGKGEDISAPAIFHYDDRPIVAIMPMQVQWDDEPAGEQVKDESAEDEADTQEGEAGEIHEENEAVPVIAASAAGENELKLKRSRRKKA